MRRIRIARVALGILCGYCLLLGATAVAAPRTFFDDFPFIAHWVAMLPPYNAHLISDIGGLSLGYAILLGWAAWRPEPGAVRAVCAAFGVTAVLHLIFHATHLARFGAADGAAELLGLGAVLVPAGVAAWAVARPRTQRGP